ncbi:hypothetical protein AJ80_02035 [Polytolypa hystricis UAMH7299]|uniref:Cell pattern formation-associated protein stuA n=1 Tax=Polytolypa hystricis (strain UAMH7299) TaxID=1447883 RepID=A0A2B7YSK4_POLH7|nr:hypothetical protein AJ80_02035 [Polytolypa hystricis UAMH7299]
MPLYHSPSPPRKPTIALAAAQVHLHGPTSASAPMASNSQPAAQPNPPVSFSRHTTGPSNGVPLSQQSHMGSFNASQSVSSTPAATPPPRSSQPSGMSMSFPTNGTQHNSIQRPGFGSFDEGNGFGTIVPYHDEYKPQIYTAVYSNVSVYEMEVNGVAVMRRRSDSWLNATQILKVAGVVKARRTKTLEKEVAAGEHEKVQGGYGKYQGTWVNYQRGVELCRHYHVEELLRPLLEYDMGQDGVSQAGQGAIDTPTKEQAMAAQRKRLYRGVDGQAIGQPPQGTYFQSISRTAASAVNAINKARFDHRRPSSIKPSPQMSSQESNLPASQQSIDSGFGSNMQHSQRTSFADVGENTIEPPRKRMRSLSTAHPKPFQPNVLPLSNSMIEPTPTEPADSFYQVDGPSVMLEDQTRGLPPLPPATTPDRFQKMKLIMTLFLDKRAKDFTNHPAFVNLSSEDLEIPLDEYYNSALHWAAMLARMPLVYALIEKGVSLFRLNGAGESALQKAVGTRNNLDYRSFSKLLQVLAPTVEIIDLHGRTVLHHIAMMAATGGGGHIAAKHYLESLLEFIVRHGGKPVQFENSDGSTSEHKHDVIGLGKFMSDLVNVQDDQGDTALNLAGRARTVLVPQLLEVGADPHVPNHTGLQPADYGVGVDMVNGTSQVLKNGNGKESFVVQLMRTKKEIFESTLAEVSTAIEQTLESINKDLSAVLSTKQDEFDQWHNKIRDSAKARQVEQKQLDEMRRRARERVQLNRQIANLERSYDELFSTLRNSETGQSEAYGLLEIGGADRFLHFDASRFAALFPEDFDISSGLSESQIAFLALLPAADTLKPRMKCYDGHNAELRTEVERLKTKNVVLGENYRRMVMACTGWSAEQADEAADGLTECIKDLNENPLPEDVAIEILMKDRGQDW